MIRTWVRSNSNGQTQEVALLKANSWGLFDMSGNVWQWVQDWYSDYPKFEVVDPKGPLQGTHRSLRGGSWYYPSVYSRTASRAFAEPLTSACYDIGFRLVRTKEF